VLLETKASSGRKTGSCRLNQIRPSTLMFLLLWTFSLTTAICICSHIRRVPWSSQSLSRMFTQIECGSVDCHRL